MNTERIDELLEVAKVLEKEDKFGSITLNASEVVDLINSYKDLEAKYSDLVFIAASLKYKNELNRTNIGG